MIDCDSSRRLGKHSAHRRRRILWGKATRFPLALHLSRLDNRLQQNPSNGDTP